MENKKVSIIVPVYNVELYIEDCLNSLLNQTYSNYEIILINDGSTDNSIEICSKYNDQKIKIFNQNNKGVSIARNVGISLATGQYIMFVDADDIVSENYIENLITSIEETNTDMVVCGYTKEKTELVNKRNSQEIKGEIINANTMLENMMENNLQEGYLWNKIFKKSIISDNSLEFEEGVNVWEDLYFVIEYLSKSDKVFAINETLYYYRTREGSAVNRKETETELIGKVKILELIMKNYNLIINNKNYYGIKRMYITVLLKYLLQIKKDNKEFIKEKLSKVKKIKKDIKIGFKNEIKYFYLKMIT